MKERTPAPRQVGPYKIPAALAPKPADRGKLDQLARRFKKHVADVSVGHREVVDVDESVRRTTPKKDVLGLGYNQSPRRSMELDDADDD